MPRRSRRLAESGIYHVMLRGVNRDAIFIEDEDFEQFLRALARVRNDSGCLVLAYCLMTNHVHLVLRTVDEPIGQVVKRLGVRYAGWFNRKYGRVGHVFQDRYLSRPVEDDAYLITVLRYVWNNPVEAGLVTAAAAYRWSSRRLLGAQSPLVDGADLQRLLPVDVLAAIASATSTEPEDPVVKRGRPAWHSDEESAELLVRACGARSPDEFAGLDHAAQRLAIRALRTQSVSYDQIGRATGMPASRVRRLHVSAVAPAPAG